MFGFKEAAEIGAASMLEVSKSVITHGKSVEAAGNSLSIAIIVAVTIISFTTIVAVLIATFPTKVETLVASAMQVMASILKPLLPQRVRHKIFPDDHNVIATG
jgi:hypothetical protein